MTDPFEQRVAIYRLIGFCEGIIKSKYLPDDVSAKFRNYVNEVSIAFEAPLIGESKNEVKW